jgi:tRNA pseudouridine38-40 synthase
MTIVRIDLAYHGAGFAGWAAQPGMRTVQSELTEALGTLLEEPVQLSVAGRTDTGVHAWAQVASFDCGGDPPEHLARALHALTGDDIAVVDAKPAPDGFDARRDARSRTYCYRLHAAPVPSPFERGLALFWPYGLDRGVLERCAETLLGTHDFTAFTPTRTEYVHFERTVLRSEWVTEAAPEPAIPERQGEVIRYWIESQSFMRGMVRALVGTMLEVASGRRSFEDFERLLAGAPREDAGDTARPHGLYLASVRY